MSTGGAATKAMINTEIAVSKVGIIITPNHPTYKRFSIEVTHSQKRAHTDDVSRRWVRSMSYSRRCTSFLDPDVRLSPHPAPDLILGFAPFCTVHRIESLCSPVLQAESRGTLMMNSIMTTLVNCSSLFLVSNCYGYHQQGVIPQLRLRSAPFCKIRSKSKFVCLFPKSSSGGLGSS